jgi:spore photoproduct lyase
MKIKRILIDERAANDPLTARIRERLPGAAIETVSAAGAASIGAADSGILAGTDAPAAAGAGEPGASLPPRAGSILLTHHLGDFVKDFPVTPGSSPCGEKYIVAMHNCPFDCSYCYLQSYLERPMITVFTNTERMKSEVSSVIRREAPARMTTGEFSDSLALDDITGTALDLLPLFRGTKTLLELRTKSANVAHLAGCGGENLLVTWTLAPGEAIRAEEPGTAGLAERLGAMSLLARGGTMVAIRLDPVIPAWYGADSYRRLLEEVAGAVEPRMIHRVETGILRFTPGLWEVVRERGRGKMLFRGEYFAGGDGRMRYYRPERIRIYREIGRMVSEILPGVPVELSMEDDELREDAGFDIL